MHVCMMPRAVFRLSQLVENEPDLPHRHVEENYDKSVAVEREFVPPAHLCPQLGNQPFLASVGAGSALSSCTWLCFARIGPT